MEFEVWTSNQEHPKTCYSSLLVDDVAEFAPCQDGTPAFNCLLLQAAMPRFANAFIDWTGMEHVFVTLAGWWQWEELINLSGSVVTNSIIQVPENTLRTADSSVSYDFDMRGLRWVVSQFIEDGPMKKEYRRTSWKASKTIDTLNDCSRVSQSLLGRSSNMQQHVGTTRAVGKKLEGCGWHAWKIWTFARVSISPKKEVRWFLFAGTTFIMWRTLLNMAQWVQVKVELQYDAQGH